MRERKRRDFQEEIENKEGMRQREEEKIFKTRQYFLYFPTLSSVYDLLSCCRNAYSIIFTHLSYFSHEYLDYMFF